MNISPEEILILKEFDGEKAGSRLDDYLDKEYNVDSSRIRQKLIEENLLEFNERRSIYTLTAKGEEIINDHPHLIYYHRKKLLQKNIDLKNFHETYIGTNESSYRKVALDLLENKNINARKNKAWNNYRNTFLNMAYIYQDIDKKQSALKNLLKVYHLDLSGLSNNDQFNPIMIRIAPGIIEKIKELILELQYDEEDIKSIYQSVVESLKLPRQNYSVSRQFEYLLNSLKNGAENVNIEIQKDNIKLSKKKNEKQGFIKNIFNKIFSK
ncbi:MAG: hypothetical protein ACOCZZ_00940 [Bacillota bacterium]